MEKTQIPERKFKRLMQKDIYLSHKDCIRYGLVSALEWFILFVRDIRRALCTSSAWCEYSRLVYTYKEQTGI